MKIKIYIIAAAMLILAVLLIYFAKFYLMLGYTVADDPAAWGQLGDYAGGILNPLLSFISIVLLIKSLSLQFEANNSLRKEIKNNEKTEKLRSFEILFFNLIKAQKELFDSFKIEARNTDGTPDHLMGAKAVIAIEDKIQDLRDSGKTDKEITEFLSTIDKNDQIFGISRAFYLLVMVVTDKLSDIEGFSLGDRSAHYKTLINFTDFAQLRLVMICVQFLEYESTKYLRSSYEFTNVASKLGVEFDQY